MREAYHRVVGEDEENGKLGASFAVIVAHVMPFMGAQTTIMQRYFLPHPADTIASQPFGMTEDLISMAMAEATSNPVLASVSLTALIVFFNLARGLVFSVKKGRKFQQHDTHPTVRDDDVVTDIEDPPNKESSANQAAKDYAALATAAFNVLVGVTTAHMVAGRISLKQACCIVAFQMIVQLLIVRIILRHILHLLKPTKDGAKEKIGQAGIRWDSAKST